MVRRGMDYLTDNSALKIIPLKLLNAREPKSQSDGSVGNGGWEDTFLGVVRGIRQI